MTNLPASVLRGDIFVVDWNPGRGSEQLGVRPALVIQRDNLNAKANYPNTIIAAISKHGKPVATHVAIPGDALNGLSEPISYVKCEQLLTIDKAHLTRKLGSVTPQQMAEVSRALKLVLHL